MFLLQYINHIMLTVTTLIKPISINTNYAVRIYIALKIKHTQASVCHSQLRYKIRTFSFSFSRHLKCCPALPRLSCWTETLLAPTPEVLFMIFNFTGNHFQLKTMCSQKGEAPSL